MYYWLRHTERKIRFRKIDWHIIQILEIQSKLQHLQILMLQRQKLFQLWVNN